MQVTILLATSLICQIRPYNNPNENRQEMWTEALLLLISYLTVCLSDYVRHPRAKYQMAYFFAALILIHFGLSLITMSAKTLQSTWRKVRLYYALKTERKRIKVVR